MNLETFIYECSACDHVEQNATMKRFADGPTKRPCPSCKSTNTISYRERTQEEKDAVLQLSGTRVTSYKSGKYFDRNQVPEGFKEVLRNVKKNNPGSTIEI